jgi:hypothetical protein
MALSDYTELQASIAGWLIRDDLTAVIPDFIRLAEVRLATDFKTQHLITETTIVTDASSKALPANNKGIISAYLSTNPLTPLDYMTPDEFASRNAASESGKPLAFTVKGQTIYFGPTPDSSYNCILSHYETPSLITDNTNSLLTNYPTLYLYASLIEASDYLQEDSSRWETKYLSALDSALEESDFLGPLSIQLRDCP